MMRTKNKQDPKQKWTPSYNTKIRKEHLNKQWDRKQRTLYTLNIL